MYLCHLPNGNLENIHTITVSENALPAHLAHNDLIGSCDNNCGLLCDDGNACTIDACDQITGECLADHPPVDCDDSNPDTIDTCDSAHGCINTPTEHHKVVFVTSEIYKGNLGGIAGADLKCNNLAAEAGLQGVYKAWLSTQEISVNSWLYNYEFGTAFINTENELSAIWDGVALTDLDWPIRADEYGSVHVEYSRAWTCTIVDGTYDSGCGLANDSACDGWRSDNLNLSAAWGYSLATSPQWTSFEYNISCFRDVRLYCFQQ